MLRFPFWMARLVDKPAGTELQPYVFFSPRKLAAYLDAQHAQHWQLHLVSRYSAVTYLTELQLLGHSTIRVNPNVDGSEGTILRIADVLDQLAD